MKLTYKLQASTRMTNQALSHASNWFGTRDWLDHILGDNGAEFIVQMPDSCVVRVRQSDGWCVEEGG